MICVPTGNEMATALRAVINRLEPILQSESSTIVHRACSLLKKAGCKKNWGYEIPNSEPMIFKRCTDRNDRSFVPTITCLIQVDESHGKESLPFCSWTIALILRYDEKRRNPRWHFDLADEQQGAPITHLKYGGHCHGDRSLDEAIKEPRWHTPVMDVILLAETVAANFFPNEWQEFRQDLSWCRHVSQSERLCYTHYMEALKETFNVSSTTMLNKVWRDKKSSM